MDSEIYDKQVLRVLEVMTECQIKCNNQLRSLFVWNCGLTLLVIYLLGK